MLMHVLNESRLNLIRVYSVDDFELTKIQIMEIKLDKKFRTYPLEKLNKIKEEEIKIKTYEYQILYIWLNIFIIGFTGNRIPITRPPPSTGLFFHP